MLGVMSTRDALGIAQEAGLDLVVVAPNADPPVAKVVDYGKWKYEQEKLKKDQKTKKQDVKGIKISPKIGQGDLDVALRKARQFLTEGDKVRLVCRFRKFELAYPELGKQKLLWLTEHLGEIGKAEREPVLSGREMVMVINPKSSGSTKKNAKAEDQQDGGEAV